MEELIKEAERLYKQIDEIQLDLVKSRLDVCEERKWKAISEMETAMCAVFQFLKCIIDRKDNIVDLGEVWHGIDEEAHGTGKVLLDSYNCVSDIIRPLSCEGDWKHIVNKYNIRRWAYIKDLLPKGGEK